MSALLDVSTRRGAGGAEVKKQITWHDLSVSDVVLAAILAAVNLGVDGFAQEFKAILQKPKAEWFDDAETDRDAALVTRALDGPQDVSGMYGEEK